MGVLLTHNLISKVLEKFRDQFGYTWKSRLLWIFRRIVFLARSWFFDLEYISIPKEWLDEYMEHWRKEVLSNLKPQPELFDCDDFAMYFIFKMREYIYRKHGVRYNGNGVVLGIVYRNGKPLGGHAWVLALVDTESEIGKVVFIEPQIGEYLTDDMTTSDGLRYEIQAVIV